jgi:uncharacterized damage-inducible protein DinB
MPDTAAPDLRYPIGSFTYPRTVTPVERREHLANIAATPRRLAEAVRGLTDTQLDTPHRPGGWSLRRIAHHLPDSHMNAYVRFKLALTEEEPAIKPYDQALWAELEDSAAPIDISLRLLEGLHGRWLALLESLPEQAFGRRFRHPESGLLSLDQTLAMYGWHGRHHVAQITSARERNGWR